jgi:hypothetical protein
VLGGFCCFFLQKSAMYWSVNAILRDASSFTLVNVHESSGFQAAMLIIGAALLVLSSICGDRKPLVANPNLRIVRVGPAQCRPKVHRQAP